MNNRQQLSVSNKKFILCFKLKSYDAYIDSEWQGMKIQSIMILLRKQIISSKLIHKEISDQFKMYTDIRT